MIDYTLSTNFTSSVGPGDTSPFYVAVQGSSALPLAFTVIMQSDLETPRLLALYSDSASDMIRFDDHSDSYSVSDNARAEDSSSTFDLANELESLRLLEDEASDIQRQITAKKQTISTRMRDNRNNMCLKHLVAECEGVLCAARVVAQRICDKMNINVDPAFGFTAMSFPSDRPLLRASMTNRHTSQRPSYRQHQQSIGLNPLNATSGFQRLETIPEVDPTHFEDSPNPVIHVLQALAGLLGLTALWVLIKSKCTSARTKVERAADREERRNRRTYRRAARRAIMRQRWDDLVRAVSCFRAPKNEPRFEDYEEKRALILQDAFLEQEADHAEKADIMEAEIRELRHAHDIVASLVIGDDLPAPHHDPAPPLVPLPYALSRVSTQYTLPSYTSETLPDYASRISRERRLSGFTIGSFTPSTSSAEEETKGLSRAASCSAVGRPSRSENSGSSVIDISTRPSGETIRTERPWVYL